MKHTITEFNLTPYPRILVVITGGTEKNIADDFLDEDATPLVLLEDRVTVNAMTFTAQRKKTREWVFIVWFPKKLEDNETIAHESVHVVNKIWDHCGIVMDLKNDEPYAYEVGYVYSCIATALKAANKK